MLTEIETKAQNFIYTVCGNSFTIPFNWNNLEGRMSMKYEDKNNNCKFRIFNVFCWCLVISVFAYKLSRFAELMKNSDVNGGIIHGILMLIASGNIIVRLCISTYSTEMLQLVSQALRCNSEWGMKYLDNARMYS